MTLSIENTIAEMSTRGRGILAIDESFKTIAQRFESIGVESSEENRRAYRELLITTKGLGEFISGAILFEETLSQKTHSGVPFTQILEDEKIVPGIKVDKGLISLPNSNDEKVTQGLDLLPQRLMEYKELGARFAKWRAVFNIDDIKPTSLAIHANVDNLARYAAICQEQDIVPIVEPELLINGDHSLEDCANKSEKVFHHLIQSLYHHHVTLEHIVLKPSMVISGNTCQNRADINAVANETVKILLRTIPAAVPSINFLSGGQTPTESTEHLNAMNAMHPNLPWNLSFSYGRALQEPALQAWAGKSENVDAAQKALYKRAKLNAMAATGEYAEGLEMSS